MLKLFKCYICRFLHPLVYGDYPASMRDLVKKRLPKFKDDEIVLVKGSYDFLGINYYTANYAKNNPNVDPNKPSQVTDAHADVSSNAFINYVKMII